MFRKNSDKRGVSTVIETVLIIAITISAVIIVAGVIIPFVKSNLAKSQSCYNAIDQLSVELGKFTCYNPQNTSIMIKRGLNADFDLQGIYVSIATDNGNIPVYKIGNNLETAGVEMYSGSSSLILPQKGGAQTYVFQASGKFITIAPIGADGNACQGINAEIPSC